MKISKAKQKRLDEIEPRLYELTMKRQQLRVNGQRLPPEEDKEFCELNHENDVLTLGQKGAFPKEVYSQDFDDKVSDLLTRTESLIARIKEETSE